MIDAVQELGDRHIELRYYERDRRMRSAIAQTIKRSTIKRDRTSKKL
ncbi:MAG: hypothetical protein HC936_14560 [Leptolyngbyaceae cyanobacterium SU_3_3]|nr:hypothetical protein [Leptolyngbyaceae cyanobacterium SU_3_3]